jgi:hypothetical protein
MLDRAVAVRDIEKGLLASIGGDALEELVFCNRVQVGGAKSVR